MLKDYVPKEARTTAVTMSYRIVIYFWLTSAPGSSKIKTTPSATIMPNTMASSMR